MPEIITRFFTYFENTAVELGTRSIALLTIVVGIFFIVAALIFLGKKKFKLMFGSIGFSAAAVIIGTAGYNIAKTAGEQVGNEIDGFAQSLCMIPIVIYIGYTTFKNNKEVEDDE